MHYVHRTMSFWPPNNRPIACKNQYMYLNKASMIITTGAMVTGETVRETNKAPTTHKPGCTHVCLLVKLLENYRQWYTCEILNEA